MKITNNKFVYYLVATLIWLLIFLFLYEKENIVLSIFESLYIFILGGIVLLKIFDYFREEGLLNALKSFAAFCGFLLVVSSIIVGNLKLLESLNIEWSGIIIFILQIYFIYHLLKNN